MNALVQFLTENCCQGSLTGRAGGRMRAGCGLRPALLSKGESAGAGPHPARVSRAPTSPASGRGERVHGEEESAA